MEFEDSENSPEDNLIQKSEDVLEMMKENKLITDAEYCDLYRALVKKTF